MILADKIIELRKKSGWSQEELAEKMNVTRQSVSKWESAQSTPDLGKILQLSGLFGVSTDYLLKDELGEAEYINEAEETPAAVSYTHLSTLVGSSFLTMATQSSGVLPATFAMTVVPFWDR